MASRYWVGGTGNWTDTAKWSATSGGSSGASVPQLGDNVFINAASAAGTFTITLPSGNDANMTNFDATGLDDFCTISITSGDRFFVHGTYVGNSNIYFTGGSGVGAPFFYEQTNTGSTKNITWNGTQINTTIKFNENVPRSTVWSFQDALTSPLGVELISGTMDTNGYAVNIYSFTNDFGGSPTLTLDASTVDVTTWTIVGGTVNATSATIRFTGTSAKTFSGGGKTYGTLNHSSGSGVLTVNGANTFTTISLGANTTTKFANSTTQTLTNFTINGTSGNVSTVSSVTNGTQFTLSKSTGTVTANYLNIRDSNVTGGATWAKGTGFVDTSNNTGWVTLTNVDITKSSQYIVTAATTYADTNSPVTIDSNSTGGSYFHIPNPNYRNAGQTFSGQDKYLHTISFKSFRVTGATGTVRAKIYAHSGSYGSTGIPTGGPLAYSDAVDLTTISTSTADNVFTFSGPNRILLSGSSKYVAVFDFDDLSQPDTSVGIYISTTSVHSGNKVGWRGTYWEWDSSWDLVFSVSGVEGGVSTTYAVSSQVDAKVPKTAVSSYAEANVSSYWTMYNGANTRVGQALNTSSAGTLDSVQFYMYRQGVPSGLVYAEVYASTGTLGSTAVGTGSVLATSDSRTASLINNSGALETFTFSGSNRIALSAATNYVVVVYVTGGNSTNNIQLGADSTPSHAGNLVSNTSGWVPSSAYDVAHYLYTSLDGIPSQYSVMNVYDIAKTAQYYLGVPVADITKPSSYYLSNIYDISMGADYNISFDGDIPLSSEYDVIFSADITKLAQYAVPPSETLDSSNLRTLKIGKAYGPITSVILGRVPQNDNVVIASKQPQSNIITSIDTGTNLFTVVGHNMEEGNLVRVQSTGTLPAPLLPDKNYYAHTNGSTDTFALTYGYEDALLGNNIIDLTTSGSGTIQLSHIETQEVQINNNQIMDDDRQDLLLPIYKELVGLEWNEVKADTVGLGWHEVGDVIIFEQGSQSVYGFIDEIHLTFDGSVRESLVSTIPDVATINYQTAGGIIKTIYNTEIKVDKQENDITSIVSQQDVYATEVQENFSQVYQDIDNIDLTIQKSGGGNLIRNSVGYATTSTQDNDTPAVLYDKFEFWDYNVGYEVATNGTAVSYSSSESQNAGGTSGQVIKLVGSNIFIKQRISVAVNTELSFGLRVKNAVGAGDATITLSNDNDTFTLTVDDTNQYIWEELLLENFVSSQNWLDLKIQVSSATGFEFTDMRLLYGTTVQGWVQSPSEILSSNVQFTTLGMRIFDNVHDTTTQVTYNEFSTRRKSDDVVLFEADDTGVVTNDLTIKSSTNYQSGGDIVIRQVTIPESSALAGIAFIKVS